MLKFDPNERATIEELDAYFARLSMSNVNSQIIGRRVEMCIKGLSVVIVKDVILRR